MADFSWVYVLKTARRCSRVVLYVHFRSAVPKVVTWGGTTSIEIKGNILRKFYLQRRTYTRVKSSLTFA